MSLRTRTSPLPQVPRPGIRSRIPIARIPQPREDRMPSTWRLAKPARIAAALRTAQAQQLRRLVRRGRQRRRRAQGVGDAHDCRSRGGLLAQLRRRAGRRARRLPAPRCAVGQVPGDGRHHVLPVARAGADPKRRPDLEPVPGLRRRRAALGRPADRGRGRDRSTRTARAPTAARLGQRGDRQARHLRARRT